MESEDGTFAQGTFETALGESIMLTVTEDSVKLQLSNEGGELILEKKLLQHISEGRMRMFDKKKYYTSSLSLKIDIV